MEKKHPQLKQKAPLKTRFLTTVFIPVLAFIVLFPLSSFLAQDTIPAGNDDQIEEESIVEEEAIMEMQEETPDDEDLMQPEEASAEDISFVKGEYTKQQKRRGERLFNGLVPFSSGQHDCASCHYTAPQEEINWNPAAYELAQVWEQDPDYSIMSIMNNPVSMRLMEDHAEMTINEEEQHLLEAFYTHLLESEEGELKPYPIRAAIFWGLGALMLLAIIDLLFTRKISFKGIHVFILLVGIAVHGQFAMAEAQRLGRTEGYAPDQPIKFSHLIHAGENEIDCKYCHFTADYSLTANFPANSLCLNCHSVIRNGTNSGAFEINKIHRAAETGEPVEWIRIHKLPDHSFFSHAQHVNAAELDCAECHGEVESMHILQQVEDLSMGWCLTCHRDNEVDFLDNPYFEIYERLHEKIKNGEIDGVTAADLGGEDCMSCHY